MKTVISNEISIYSPTPEVRKWARDNLFVTNPDYQQMMRLGKEDTIARRRIPKEIALFIETNSKDMVIPAGCLYALWPMIRNHPYELRYNEPYRISASHFESRGNVLKLYEPQQKAVDTMLAYKGGILEAPCGAGKTEMAVALTKAIGQRTLMLVHTGDLLAQAKARFLKYFPNLKIGTVTEGKVELGEDVTIATWQTLCKVDRRIYTDYFNVVITDESHHVTSSPTNMKNFGMIVDSIKARYKYGITATPSRADTMINGMYAILGVSPEGEFKPTYVISKSDTNTLTSRHEMIQMDTPFDYTTLNEDGSMNYSYLMDYLSSNENRNGQIVKNIIRCLDQGRKQLVLCSLVKQCDWFQERLESLGIRSCELVGSVSSKKRNQVLNREVEWDVIIATYSLAKEGLDLPELDTLHLAAPQKLESIVVQSAGRIERVREGKKEPVIYDYVDVNFPYCLGAYKKRKSHLKNR